MIVQVYDPFCCPPMDEEPNAAKQRYTSPKDWRMQYGNQRIRLDKASSKTGCEEEGQIHNGLSMRQPL